MRPCVILPYVHLAVFYTSLHEFICAEPATFFVHECACEFSRWYPAPEERAKSVSLHVFRESATINMSLCYNIEVDSGEECDI